MNGVHPRRRSRWVGPAFVAAAVAGIGALLSPALGLGLLAGPSGLPGSGTDEGPSLPREFAPYSALTGKLSAGPPGRIVASYRYKRVVNDQENMEPVALASDRDAYRVVDAARGRGYANVPAPTLLAGDGSKIAVADWRGPERDIAVIDAATGRTTSFKLGFDATVTLLAWSPSARYLAFAARSYDPLPVGTFSSDRPRGGRLHLLDTETGDQRPLSAAGIPASVAEAAFSPDGSLLAVQEAGLQPLSPRMPGRYGAEILLVDAAADMVTRRLAVSGGLRIAGQQAWSPDGRSLLLEVDQRDTRLSVTSSRPIIDRGILDVATGQVVPGPGGSETLLSFLGWRSPTRVMVLDTFKDFSIVESNLTGGMREVLTRVDADPGDDRYVDSLQLAYTLLPTVRIRPVGAIDRGPWPDWLRWSVVAPLAAFTIGVALFVHRLWSRRMRRRFLQNPVLPLRA